jgi:hypothetical protein
MKEKAQKLPGVSLEPDFESFFYFSFLPIPSPPLSGITRKKQFLIDNTFLLRLATANRIQGKFPPRRMRFRHAARLDSLSAVVILWLDTLKKQKG